LIRSHEITAIQIKKTPYLLHVSIWSNQMKH